VISDHSQISVTGTQIDVNSAFYHIMSRNKKNKTRHELTVSRNASV